MKRVIFTLILLFSLLFTGCVQQAPESKPYSDELLKRLDAAESQPIFNQNRPDYLPGAMYSELPGFPKDFYSIRTLIKTGVLKNLGEIEEKYWMQPEFFPNFEDIGVPMLQHPPSDRWGAQGYLSYPAESGVLLNSGESISVYFFMKSSYLVETYQGIYLRPSFPESSTFENRGTVLQNSGLAEQYFDVQVSPNPFILEPNFPKFKRSGTQRVEIKITADEDTPPGTYAVILETEEVPADIEQNYIRKYLNLYVSGSLLKLSKPYHMVLINVPPRVDEQKV